MRVFCAVLLVLFAPAENEAFASLPLLRRTQMPHVVGPACCAVPPSPPGSAEQPSALPKREVDSRGFVVPQVGDVVKMPSKWPGEFEVGQVDFVQYVGSRGAYEVDLFPLASIGQYCYRLPGKKPSLIRTDVAKLGRLVTEYVPERDAYRVNPADLLPVGGRKTEDKSVTAQGLAEYAALKAELLREAALLGFAGVVVSNLIYGGDVAFAFGLGSAAGCTYLALLQKETDAFSSDENMGRAVAALVSGRLATPVIALTILASRGLATKGSFSLALVPREEFGAVIIGFLAYKAPLLLRQIGTALSELTSNEDAQAPIEKGMTGSLGMMTKIAQANFKSKRDREAADAAANARKAPASKVVVVCGPSGVGKSTLIARLLAEAPTTFGFSVSCTTRPPRAGEQNGVDYSFLTDDEFDAMIEADEFIEYASIGGCRYGTSVSAVEKVAASDRVCLLDLDVQGVQALVARRTLSPYCVWLAAPSLDALRGRLRGRGTEDSAEIERRISRAVEEIEFSLSARCFDKVVLNDDLDKAYRELKAGIDEATQPS